MWQVSFCSSFWVLGLHVTDKAMRLLKRMLVYDVLLCVLTPTD